MQCQGMTPTYHGDSQCLRKAKAGGTLCWQHERKKDHMTLKDAEERIRELEQKAAILDGLVIKWIHFEELQSLTGKQVREGLLSMARIRELEVACAELRQASQELALLVQQEYVSSPGSYPMFADAIVRLGSALSSDAGKGILAELEQAKARISELEA